MSDDAIARLVVGLFLVAHLTIGTLALRDHAAYRFVPWLNLVTAGVVVAYWIRRWYDVVVNGILWYGEDQLLPAYAIGVCIVSMLAITRRATLAPLHWTIFGLHVIVILGATVFMFTFKMNRLF